MHSVRTTITIHPGLLERLKLFAQGQGRSMSAIIEEGITRVMTERETQQRERMYRTLKQLQGVGDPTLTDVSTTLNQTLYGERGAWKGRDAKL